MWNNVRGVTSNRRAPARVLKDPWSTKLEETVVDFSFRGSEFIRRVLEAADAEEGRLDERNDAVHSRVTRADVLSRPRELPEMAEMAEMA